MTSRDRLRFVAAALLGGAASRIAARAPDAEGAARYRRVPPSRDGIGKLYMGREISQVMGWQGAAWLERAERDREEGGRLLPALLRLRTGRVVADVGAGTGWHARRFARAVAPGGRVLATDVQPQMLRLLDENARREGLDNVEPVRATPLDSGLAPGSVDLAVMVDVYHELEFPYEVTASVVAALRPGGELAWVEYRADDPRVPIKPLHTMSVEQIRREAADHPAIVFDRADSTSLPWQHLVVFRKPGA